MSSIDQSKQFIPLNIAVLTISDTRSLADDKSGTTLVERLTAAGHKLAAREIVTDDAEAIRGIVRKWIADTGVDVIITTGGTGFTGRDVTPEEVGRMYSTHLQARMPGLRPQALRSVVCPYTMTRDGRDVRQLTRNGENRLPSTAAHLSNVIRGSPRNRT